MPAAGHKIGRRRGNFFPPTGQKLPGRPGIAQSSPPSPKILFLIFQYVAGFQPTGPMLAHDFRGAERPIFGSIANEA
jgi:hypothetical protein